MEKLKRLTRGTKFEYDTKIGLKFNKEILLRVKPQIREFLFPCIFEDAPFGFRMT